jgi:phage shock protein E
MTKLIVAVVIALVLAFLLVRPSGKNRVDGAEARRLVEQGAVLLDVRTAAEFGGGHIQGAINIPVQELDARLADVGDKDKTVIVYCRSGARSARAAATLEAAGYTVRDLGSMAAW